MGTNDPADRQALLRRSSPGRKLVYEAHEVFSDTAPPAKRARAERLAGLLRAS